MFSSCICGNSRIKAAEVVFSLVEVRLIATSETRKMPHQRLLTRILVGPVGIEPTLYP